MFYEVFVPKARDLRAIIIILVVKIVHKGNHNIVALRFHRPERIIVRKVRENRRVLFSLLVILHTHMPPTNNNPSIVEIGICKNCSASPDWKTNCDRNSQLCKNSISVCKIQGPYMYSQSSQYYFNSLFFVTW